MRMTSFSCFDGGDPNLGDSAIAKPARKRVQPLVIIVQICVNGRRSTVLYALARAGEKHRREMGVGVGE